MYFSYFHSRASPHDHPSTLMTTQTPPSTHVSQITDHLLMTAISPAEDHIEILSHIEFQYGGSKIQDSPGLLGRNLGSQILDLPY